MQNYFIFQQHLTAKADPAISFDTVQKLWNRFCFTLSDLSVQPDHVTQGHYFILGNINPPALPDGKEFVISVTESGVAIIGRDTNCLMRGYISLLMQIEDATVESGQDTFRIPCGTTESNYLLPVRMIHFCIFPETEFSFIRKMIRLAGLCQYTHVVLEFWGTLQFDCMKELAWPEAFTKDQAKELIEEIRAFGMEPIPMSNQLGHATASRLKYGKHVVLDQNPALRNHFSPDGWVWNIVNPKTRKLLANIRAELYDLFGQGNYIHLGCDEAYYIKRCDNLRAFLPQYLHDLTAEVVAEGRRPLLWSDMLLDREKFPRPFESHCAPGEDVILWKALHPETVLIDWQYNIKEAPIPSTPHMMSSGFDVMGGPWLNPDNIKAHIDTLTAYNSFGIMLTTWHTLKEQTTGILNCAHLCGADTFYWSSFSSSYEETATMLRTISFEGNTYEETGWSKLQIEV